MNRTITILVNLLRTFADELEGNCVEAVASEGTGQPAPKKRGRAAAGASGGVSGAAAQAKPEPQATPEGMSLDQLKELIQPAVEAAAGKQVKDLITKHGGTQLSNLPPAAHAAFAEDVKGLVY